MLKKIVIVPKVYKSDNESYKFAGTKKLVIEEWSNIIPGKPLKY